MILRNLFSLKKLVLLPAFLFLLQSLLVSPVVTKPFDYLPPPTIIKELSVGFNMQLSDTFWLRAIQDFDYCDHPTNNNTCKGKSWLFQVIDLSTDLDKNFFEAFFFGGLALTVIISDYEGATKIFDKGVESFPTQWELSYAAGYHAMVEEKNFAKAGKLYLAAAENGAPSWVRILAGRMAADGGDIEFAEKIIEKMIEISAEPKYIERLKNKLDQVKRVKKSI